MCWESGIKCIARRAKTWALTVALAFATLMGRSASAETITILTGSDQYYLPIILAVENGYFRDQGLTVNHRMFPSGTDAMLAFRGIGAEFVASGDAPSLILWEGNDVVGVAPIFASPDNLFGVVRSELKTAADLKGKKIGVRKGSTADYFLTTYLLKNGVNPADVNIINLSPPECVPALSSGSIDGFFLWRPYPTLALQVMKDKARELTTARGYYLEQIYLTANRKFAEANPQVVEKVLKALARSVEFVTVNPAKAAEITARKIKASPEIVTPVIDTKPYTLRYGSENRDQLLKLVTFLRGNGKIKTDINLEVAFDPRYLRKVDPKYVEVR